MKPFAKKLKELRKGREWQLDDVATRVGVSRGMVGHYETEKYYPPPDVLAKLAKAFGVKLDELVALLPADHPARLEPGITLPLLGAVAAGGFCPLLEAEVGQRVPVRERYPEGSLAAIVSGHSCTNFGIFDGDLVIVRPTTAAVEGMFVIAETGEGLTLKGFWNGELYGWGPKSAKPIRVSLTEVTAIRGVVIQRTGPVRFSLPPVEPVILPKTKGAKK